MKLRELIEFSNGKLIGKFDLNLDICKFSIDSRSIDDKTFFIPIKGEKTDGHDYIESAIQNGAIGFFTSREIDEIPGKIIIKVDDTLKAMQDLARNIRIKLKDIPLIAITGSVGKTTTKDMIYSVLKEKFNVLRTKGNFNNDIGMPLTLINYDNEDIIVLEMGMNHFGEISFLSNIAKPDIAVIINVGHSHIGNLGSRENILKAKLEILDGMDESGVLILNGDNDMLATVKDTKQKIITFGFENDTDTYAYNIRIEKNCTVFNIKEDEKLNIMNHSVEHLLHIILYINYTSFKKRKGSIARMGSAPQGTLKVSQSLRTLYIYTRISLFNPCSTLIAR